MRIWQIEVNVDGEGEGRKMLKMWAGDQLTPMLQLAGWGWDAEGDNEEGSGFS